MKTTLEVLQEARANVARPGAWMKGAFYHGNPVQPICACSLGWINLALTGNATDDEYSIGALMAFDLVLPPHQTIDRWNDAPERTQAEVVAAFDEVIRSVEAA